jgi:hypothetical protein
MSGQPDRKVTDAAAVVQDWLDSQNATPLPAEQIARMTPAQRLDYAPRFDQKSMPDWRPPGERS